MTQISVEVKRAYQVLIGNVILNRGEVKYIYYDTMQAVIDYYNPISKREQTMRVNPDTWVHIIPSSTRSND